MSLAELTEEMIDETLMLNLKVPLLASMRVANSMREHGRRQDHFHFIGGRRAGPSCPACLMDPARAASMD